MAKNKLLQAAAARRHYLKHSAEMTRIYSDEQRIRLRDVVVREKAKPCADCDVQYQPWVMDFDHLGDDKERNVADMVRRAVSVETLMAEIAKCEVVCANCHRERTHERRLRQRSSMGEQRPHKTLAARSIRAAATTLFDF